MFLSYCLSKPPSILTQKTKALQLIRIVSLQVRFLLLVLYF